MVDGEGVIHYANLSAEQFFGVGRARLVSHPLTEFVPEDSPLFSLLEQVLATGGAVAENGVTLSSPRIGNRFCGLRLSPIVESDGLVAVSLVEQSIARSIDRQMSQPQRRPLGERARRHAGARGQESAVGHPRRRPAARAVGAGQRARAHQPDLRGDRPHRRAGRPHGGLRRRPADRPRPAQHPPGAEPRAAPVAERLRQERALHRELRSVAARRVRRSRPADPGVPQPGEECLRGAGRRRARDRAVDRLQARPAPRRAGPAGEGEPAAGRVGARQRPRRVGRDPRPPVRRLRHQQADRHWPRPRPGRQDHQRSRRRDRISTASPAAPPSG